jgi:hypothetical protein
MIRLDRRDFESSVVSSGTCPHSLVAAVLYLTFVLKMIGLIEVLEFLI